jgi:hypothetical protein
MSFLEAQSSPNLSDWFGLSRFPFAPLSRAEKNQSILFRRELRGKTVRGRSIDPLGRVQDSNAEGIVNTCMPRDQPGQQRRDGVRIRSSGDVEGWTRISNLKRFLIPTTTKVGMDREKRDKPNVQPEGRRFRCVASSPSIVSLLIKRGDLRVYPNLGAKSLYCVCFFHRKKSVDKSFELAEPIPRHGDCRPFSGA